MNSRYTVVCDEDLSRGVQHVARKYELTHEEAVRQLVEVGLEHLEEEVPA